MTEEQRAKLEAALADVPERFITGRLYREDVQCYCLLGWLGHKAGVPVEDVDEMANWILNHPTQRRAGYDLDTFSVIAAEYGLQPSVWHVNDEDRSAKIAEAGTYSFVDAKTVVASLFNSLDLYKTINA